jgi:hypothetical protein
MEEAFSPSQAWFETLPFWHKSSARWMVTHPQSSFNSKICLSTDGHTKRTKLHNPNEKKTTQTHTK